MKTANKYSRNNVCPINCTTDCTSTHHTFHMFIVNVFKITLFSREEIDKKRIEDEKKWEYKNLRTIIQFVKENHVLHQHTVHIKKKKESKK